MGTTVIVRLLGWETAERSCPSKQLACLDVGGVSEVTFKPLVPSLRIREGFSVKTLLAKGPFGLPNHCLYKLKPRKRVTVSVTVTEKKHNDQNNVGPFLIGFMAQPVTLPLTTLLSSNKPLATVSSPLEKTFLTQPTPPILQHLCQENVERKHFPRGPSIYHRSTQRKNNHEY
ncbi:hypothetical protein J6590_081351 [Homalodisca vitripennis]|nr:hypothetical protein J6590_081351 [Homalodisca vitripennis]